MIRTISLVSLTALASFATAQTPPAANPATPRATEDPSSDEAQRREVVEQLAVLLEDSYVFPDVARRYAARLRQRAAAGDYANLGDRFAETLEAELQAIHPDRHLRVGPANLLGGGPRIMRRPPASESASPAPGAPVRRILPAGSTATPAPAGAAPRRVMRMPDPASAVGRSGWIAPGVAYIELGLFPGTPESLSRIRSFLDTHRDAHAVIFDIRAHRGGGLAEMDLLFGRLFARETELLAMDTRRAVADRGGEPYRDLATLRAVAGPEGVSRRMHFAIPDGVATALRNARIFVLTSRRSGSAAEHFALALKRSGRATLIGEPTAGAGHYGGVRALGHGFAAFIPVGRTFDTATGRDWEGSGVAPNVEMPADLALDEALRQLGVSPMQRLPLS